MKKNLQIYLLAPEKLEKKIVCRKKKTHNQHLYFIKEKKKTQRFIIKSLY